MITRPSSILAVSCLLWVLAVGGGTLAMLKYEGAPGTAGNTPARWPDAFQVARAPERATLVMFAHPHCPCTRASLEELARLIAQCPGELKAHVLFLRPVGFSADWVRTDLWRTAAAIPGVDVGYDDGGTLAHRFGAETSGHVVLYDSTGRLLFHGGITGSRGHSGDNAGRSAIVALLRREFAETTGTPVFGCSLRDDRTGRGGETVCAK